MKNLGINHQIEPPGNHKSNNSEQAIQTQKSQFIRGICLFET